MRNRAILLASLAAGLVSLVWLACRAALVFEIADAQGAIALAFIGVTTAAIFGLSFFPAYGMFRSEADKRALQALCGVAYLAIFGYVIFSSVSALKMLSALRVARDAIATENDLLWAMSVTEFPGGRTELENRIAANANTPAAILRELFSKQELGINIALAANPSSPADVLESLKEHPNKYVQRELESNPSLVER